MASRAEEGAGFEFADSDVEAKVNWEEEGRDGSASSVPSTSPACLAAVADAATAAAVTAAVAAAFAAVAAAGGAVVAEAGAAAAVEDEVSRLGGPISACSLQWGLAGCKNGSKGSCTGAHPHPGGG